MGPSSRSAAKAPETRYINEVRTWAMGVKSDITWPRYLEQRFDRWELAIRVAMRGESAPARAELLELLDRGLCVREGRRLISAELSFYALLLRCLGADPGVAE